MRKFDFWGWIATLYRLRIRDTQYLRDFIPKFGLDVLTSISDFISDWSTIVYRIWLIYKEVNFGPVSTSIIFAPDLTRTSVWDKQVWLSRPDVIDEPLPALQSYRHEVHRQTKFLAYLLDNKALCLIAFFACQCVPYSRVWAWVGFFILKRIFEVSMLGSWVAFEMNVSVTFR